jgi:cyclopropane fatty-acyl-phospholipid synthase-like methyltransferase
MTVPTDDFRYRGQFAMEQSFLQNPLMATVKLARYKFPARLLSARDRVLDLGCGAGYGSYFYATAAREVVGLDLNPDLPRMAEHLARDNLRLVHGDILAPPAEIASTSFDSIVCLDVIEHFSQDDGRRIIESCSERLTDRGMLILGSPSRCSAAYRSQQSRHVHVHEYEPDEMRELCELYFPRTLLFSMNDEVVHTGFSKMAWFYYVIAFN